MDFLTQYTSSDYYLRDKELGLEPNKQYVSHLQKLGYWEFDHTTKINEFIKFELNKLITSELQNYSPELAGKTIGSFLPTIQNSEKYKSYLQYLDKAETRSKILSECGYAQFYNLCTNEELEYLGW